MTPHRLLRVVCLVLLASGAPVALTRAQAPSPDAQLSQAKELLDNGKYEAAIAALDPLIVSLEPLAPKDPAAMKLLPVAFEYRARARFQVGNTVAAAADFRALLRLLPGFKFADRVPGNVSRMLEDLRKSSVGHIILNLTPVDAELELDGVPFVPAAGQIPLAAGPHSLSGRRPGCRSASQSFTVPGGGLTEVVLALERIAATVSLVTSPPDVEVEVDGVSRGRTESGPQPPRWADPIAKAGLQPGSVSKPLLIDDLGLGSHILSFARECYVGQDLQATIDTLTDKFLGPVKLDRAWGTITVESQPAGAMVWLDGEPKGTTPVQIDSICEGTRAIEMRSSWGRYVHRLELKAGENAKVNGVVKPTVAVLAVNGLPKGYMGTDQRMDLETRFATARNLTLFAPASDKVEQVLAAEKLPRGWLAFNGSRSEISDVAKAITPQARLQLSGRLAKALEVQGVAELTARPGGDRNQFFLSILAADSSEPDVLELTTDNPDSVNSMIARLDKVPAMYRLSAGITVADVLDVSGAVVVSVDAAAQKAGLAAGDIITKADGKPLTDGSAFAAIIAGNKASDSVTVEVGGRTGGPRTATLTVALEPCLVAMNDQSLLFNNLVLVLRRDVATSGTTVDPIVRLNLAVALMRLGNYPDARAELAKIKLAAGPGVSGGTVHYLLGLCHEQLGPMSEAEKEWGVAAGSDGQLTQDGPLIQELAREKLAKLRK
jgi:tetratricopeptide (TPR) repeat protein